MNGESWKYASAGRKRKGCDAGRCSRTDRTKKKAPSVVDSYQDWPTHKQTAAVNRNIPNVYILIWKNTYFLDAYITISGGDYVAIMQPMTRFDVRDLRRVLKADRIEVEGRGPDGDQAVKTICMIVEGMSLVIKAGRLRVLYKDFKDRGRRPAGIPYPGDATPQLSRNADGTMTATVVVKDPEGMHCRSWAVIRKYTYDLNATLTIEWRGKTVTLIGGDPGMDPNRCGFYLLRRLLDPVKCGDTITVTAEGPDARTALDVVIGTTEPKGWIGVMRSEDRRRKREGLPPVLI